MRPGKRMSRAVGKALAIITVIVVLTSTRTMMPLVWMAVSYCRVVSIHSVVKLLLHWKMCVNIQIGASNPSEKIADIKKMLHRDSN